MFRTRRKDSCRPSFPMGFRGFPLALASEGERVRIVFVKGGWSLKERLVAMGIKVDDVVEVVHRHPRGAVIISRNGTSYGLGGGMAQKIMVEKE